MTKAVVKYAECLTNANIVILEDIVPDVDFVQ